MPSTRVIGDSIYQGYVPLGPDGNPVGAGYSFPTVTSLAAGSAGTAAAPTAGSVSGPVSGVQARSYIASIGGTPANGAQVQLEALAADGIWDAVGAAITARGTPQNTYVIAANSTLRWRNTGTAAWANFSATLG